MYSVPNFWCSGYRWGWKEGDNWTGFLGELYRDEADIGLANLYITINRVEALDYSAPFSDDVRLPYFMNKQSFN